MTDARVRQARSGRRLADMDITTDRTTHDTHSQRRGRLASFGHHLLARWPSVLGLLALLSNLPDPDPHLVAMIIILAATCYLAAAAVGSRRSVWAMVVVVSAVVILSRLTGLDPIVMVLVTGALFAVFGFLRRTGEARREVGLQALGFVGFSALALAAMMATPVLALYLAAAVALGHTVWDVVHHRRDRAVTRSLTEACFVLDLGLGLALLVTAWTTQVL